MNAFRFIPALIFFIIFGLMLFGLLQSPNMKNLMAETDRPLPAFDLPLLGKESHLSEADLKGHVSLVHFFATWCGICMREQPRMISFAKEMDIPIYAIMWRSPQSAVENWQKATTTYENTALDYNGAAGMQFGIMGVPHTFLIDKHQRIRYGFIGNISSDEMNTRLIPLIKKYRDEK